ncbi:MAG: BMP family ABC transporter substrate-binding protein [Bacteroidota bacterium]
MDQHLLSRSVRFVLLSGLLLIQLAGIVQPVSALGPPVITEGDSISVVIGKNGTPYAFSLTLHATDPDGDPLTWYLYWVPSHGDATASGTGPSQVVTYTPNTGYAGDDSFIVRVTDANDQTDSITVNVTVAPKIGLVTDADGLFNGGFNWLAYQGLLRAETDLGIRKNLYQSSSAGDYLPLLQQCADEGNTLCFAVNFTMAEAAVAAADSRPNTLFASLDGWPSSARDNLRSVHFAAKEVGYLAGALAGRMTATQVIGVIGGMATIPDVAAFVDGYRNGAQCANPNVRGLRQYAGKFDDPALGASLAQQMIANGADVIFAPAGPTGVGSVQYSAGHGVWSIGVDTDQYITVFGSGSEPGAEKVLTSAMKRLGSGLYNTVNDYMAGAFTSGAVTYGLAKNGVGLAPYHEASASIPLATKNYVAAVRSRIISGTNNVNLTCRFTTTSGGAQDGWILESGEMSNTGGTMNATSTTVVVGDNIQDKQYLSLLSFNTGGLPDNAIITKAQLKIRRQGVVGTNLFTTLGTLRFDIRKGYFSTSSALQLADFGATPSLSLAGAFGTTLSSGWYTANLGTTALAYINKAGPTQFRLRFYKDDNDDLGADYLQIFSGNAAAAYRPQLIISYRQP